MIQEQYYVLAFDNDDTKKIVKYFKDNKNNKKFIAITPNALETLKKNAFHNIFTPHDICKNLHEELANENIIFRNQIDLNMDKNKENFFFNESFNNIIIQCFSTLNFFYKILNFQKYYYSFLNDKFELISNKKLYDNIVKKIILDRYGIFKISKKSSNQNFYLKKIINNFLFYYLKKKDVIFNFLGNKKKLSFSNNSVEITFGSPTNSLFVNLYLLSKSFLEFFFQKKTKKIYPEIKYNIDINLINKMNSFIIKLGFNAFKDVSKEFIYFLCENVQYENELEKFLNKRFNNINLKYLFADHVTWMDPYCVSKFLDKKKKEVFLCSHGMIDLNDNKIEKNELLSLANGLFYSKYASTVIAQTPMGYEVSNSFLKYKNFNIIKAHPFAYNGQRIAKKNVSNDINILFAGTYKVFLSRPYIYQGSFEFINTIKKLVLILKNYKNLSLTINIRTNDEIDNNLYEELYEKNSNVKIVFNDQIETLMQNSHLLITNFSTLIDEYSYLKKPVIILNDFLKYETYKHTYSDQTDKENIRSIYYYSSEELSKKLIKIIEKIKNKKITEKPKHIWKENEAIDNKILLKVIQSI